MAHGLSILPSSTIYSPPLHKIVWPRSSWLSCITPFSILVGGIFQSKKLGYRGVDVYYAPSTRDGYVLMVAHCS